MKLFFILIIISISNVFSQELVLGEERIEPGIIFIFEGAIKDKVYPKSINLVAFNELKCRRSNCSER